MLPEEKMPEAEVSLRLAFFLIEQNYTSGDVDVAIDGAQVKTAEKVHFPIADFLSEMDWQKTDAPDTDTWQGEYSHQSYQHRVCIHSAPGKGDVVVRLKSGKKLRVESKKGPMSRSKSSQEYPLLRGALGQILTVEDVADDDLLAVAVPSSPKFEELAKRWRQSPLVAKCGILILTVGRNNYVGGFD